MTQLATKAYTRLFSASLMGPYTKGPYTRLLPPKQLQDKKTLTCCSSIMLSLSQLVFLLLLGTVIIMYNTMPCRSSNVRCEGCSRSMPSLRNVDLGAYNGLWHKHNTAATKSANLKAAAEECLA